MNFIAIKNIDELLIKVSNKNQHLEIFCDLDSVLCDFDKKFEELSGLSPLKFIEENGKEDIYKIIDGYGTFWVELEWMPDGKKLWNFIKEYNPTILTTPGGDIESCKKQKREWVKKEIGEVPLKFLFHKKKYATKNSILIDDRTKNIDPWKKSGGIGILHKSVEGTIKKLKELFGS